MEDENIRETFGHKFRIINNGIDKHMSNSWSKEGYDITRAQCATLHFIKAQTENGQMILQKDVEQQFAIAGATASHILQSLEKKGLITRCAIENDGRKKALTLTQEGLHTDALGRVNMLRMEENLVKGMTKTQVEQLTVLLEKVITNLEEMDE